MLRTVEKVLLMQELEVFRDATSEQLGRLALISRERHFEESEILFERGARCDVLPILIDGKVSLGSAGDGRVVESAILDLLSFFAREGHSTQATALSKGLLLETPYAELEELLSSEGELGWIVLREVARLGRSLLSASEYDVS